MRRLIYVVVVVALIGLLVGAYYATRSSTPNVPEATDNANDTTPQSGDTPQAPGVSPNGQNGSALQDQQVTRVVTMRNNAFEPTALSVPAGSVVTWTNQDAAEHTVTEIESPTGATGSDSGRLREGQSYSATFTTPGTYTYRCTLHPDMKGTVTVME